MHSKVTNDEMGAYSELGYTGAAIMDVCYKSAGH